MTKHTFYATLLCGATLFAIGTAMAAESAKDGAQKPVYFLLYSRYSDHVVPQEAEKRLSRLLPLMEQLKKDEPSASVLLEFSGAMMEPLKAMDAAGGHIGRLKEMARQGLAEFGYDGKDEPTYRNRPRVRLREIADPEKRWIARGEAADTFLKYYRAPFTGDVDKSRPGGLKLVQDTLGELAVVGNWTPYVGSDAPEVQRLSRLNQNSMLYGFRAPDVEWGVEGYANSVDGIARALAAPGVAPEVYWEDGRLRTAEVSLRGIKPVSTTDGIEALKAYLSKLDRSAPHVIQMEIVGELRYLFLRVDGSVQFPPLVWAFDHPDDPLQPNTIKAFRPQVDVEKEYRTEQETLQWLVKEFFPANPGSRFVSIGALKKATSNTVGSEIPAGELREAVEDLTKDYAAHQNFTGKWAEARGHYYSTAEMFELVAASLAGMQKDGKAPASVKLGNVYGPMVMGWDLGDKPVTVDAASVVKVAAAIAPGLRDESWKPVPSNMVPSMVTVDGQQINAARFLDLMMQVYLGAKGKVTANLCMMFSPSGMVYPTNIPKMDMGNTWTLKPTSLKLN
jgi:hypothetical protein